MYLTHTFASRETLSRAHSWLTAPVSIPDRCADLRHPPDHDRRRPDRLAAARVLINAVERADPDGFPGFWDQPSHPHSPPEVSQQDNCSEPAKPHSSVIGWHPLD